MKLVPGNTGLLLICTALAAYSQSPVPAIRNITVNAVSHASVNLQFRTSVPAWVELKYGLSSGNYIYTSASYPSAVGYEDNNNIDASISLGGLAPGTTYYVLPTARPDEDDDTNICATPACGAVEQVFTTQPLPAVHPVPPAPPAAWVPAEPDTSSYTVIPMQVSSSTGECVAAANVAQQPRWNAAVLAGDNITAILGKIFYGTVIEFPQGATCKVFQTESSFHTGYVLPALGIDPNASGDIDSPNHRWIVFRTKTVSPADFPPFGVRTGPQWASKLARLVAQNPGEPNDGSAPGLGVQNFNGQLFDCYAQGCHHFWFENMEWTHRADSTVYPPGLVDPPAFVDYIRLYPNGSDVTTAATTPDYNVVDRIYAHGQPWPSRETAVFSPGGNHWAILNSWAQANMWWQGVFPQSNPALAGAVLTIPKSFYQNNAFDNTPIGMTAGATATFTVPNGYTGVFYAWIDQTGLTIDYQTGTGVSLACAGCTAKAEASPSRNSVPATSMWYFNGHFSNGAAVLDQSMPWNTIPTELTAFRPLGIYDWPGNFGYVDNNYISAIGQTVYNDTYGSVTDQTWTHNYFYFPRWKMQNSGQWDGYGYSFRNVFETKQALRWRLEGNIFDGSASYQNPGNAVYIAGSYAGPFSTGTQDIEITNNIFKHLSAGFQCAGGGAQQPPDSPTAARIEVFNNLWLDLNRGLYNNGGGGLFSGPFSSYPGCEDLNIHRNTVDLTLGTGPALFLMGTAANGASVMGEGLNFSENEMHLSLNALDALSTVCGQIAASHPASPATLCSGGTTGTTYTQMLNTSYLHAASPITPSWNFTGNVIIGALTIRGLSAWTDIDQATLNGIAANFPPGNIFPTGATMAARNAAVNWDPVTYRIVPSAWNPGNIGADVDAITSATGTVTNIAVTPAATSVQFAYTAPDTRACYADVSPDGVSWTRSQDAEGATSRTLTITALTAGASYQYRLMCYSDQSAQYEYLANQITSGAVTTLATSGAGSSGSGAGSGGSGAGGGGGGVGAGGGGGGIATGSGSPVTASPTSLAFTAASHALTGSASVTVTDGEGSSSFNAGVTYNSGLGWLSVTPASGTIGSQVLIVSYNAAGLGMGTYNGNVIVSTSGGSVSVPVTLSVVALVTVSPQSLNFTYRLGETTPPATQMLSIFSTPSGATYSVTSSGETWLSAPNVSSATAPGSILVSIMTGAVSAGNSTGHITITPAGGNPVSVPVSVTVQAAAPPALSISPTSQSYTLTQGSSATGGQVTASNTGGGVLQFSAQATPATGTWLKLSGSGSGSATPATPAVVSYTVDPSGLTPGIYTGQITVKDGTGNQATIAVSLTLSQAAQSILLSESGITMSGMAGANVSSSQSFSILNTGSGTMSWTAAASTVSGGNWLSVSPASGSSIGGQSGSAVTVTANTRGLAAGQYYGSVQVAASGASVANIANSPESVSVLLNVTAADAGANVSLSTGAVILAGPAGSTKVESQPITLFNPGTTSLSFTATASTASGESWLTVSPASGSLAQGGTPLTIQANPAGLGPGIQTGTVRVAFNDGTVDSIMVVAIATGGTTASNGLTQSTPQTAAATCVGGNASYLVTALAEPLEQAALQPGVAQLVRVLDVDDCGRPVTAGGGAQVTFSNQDAPLSLTDSGGGVWEGTWIPTNPGANVSVNAIATSETLQSATTSLTVSVADPSADAAPQPSGVVNAASSAQAAPMIVAPGAFISVYGTGLASGNAVGDTSVPLPSTLNGAQLLLGDQPLPLSYSSTGQINGVVPQSLNPDATYQLVVARGLTMSVPIPVTVAQYQPAIFSVDSSGSGQGAVLLAGTSLLAAPSGNGAQPAQSGGYLSVFCTGLGPVAGPNGEAPPADGAAAPSTPLYQTKAMITATLGGVSAPVVFAGLSPGSVALYQVNVEVPAGAQTGNAVPLILTLTDPATGTAYVSNTVTVAIQ